MCPSLIQIGSKTAEKNYAQTNRQTDRQTNKQPWSADTTKIMVTWPWTNCSKFVCLQCFDCCLGVRESIQPIKHWVMRCWRGCLCGGRYKWFAYGPADATSTPSSLASCKSRLVLRFWYRLTLTQVVLERGRNLCLTMACVFCAAGIWRHAGKSESER